MDLWHGTISEFIKEGEASSITGIMLNHFWNYHGYQPSEGEAKAGTTHYTLLPTSLRRLLPGMSVLSLNIIFPIPDIVLTHFFLEKIVCTIILHLLSS